MMCNVDFYFSLKSCWYYHVLLNVCCYNDHCIETIFLVLLPSYFGFKKLNVYFLVIIVLLL